jgi:hypothetical protein
MARNSTASWIAALGAIVVVATGPLSALAPDKVVKANSQVSMTGCLRADGGKYMLTHLQGDQAPRARSWKTGFIVKTTKNVVVSAPKNGVKLQDHIGRQVTIVGMSDGDTHLTARSIKRIAASCS